MRWTETLVPTLRDNPQEAEIPSHRLMLRAGLIRKLAGGLYTFLPLGLRALRKVEKVVREEMDRAGALEVLMPALQPRDLWERSQRYDIMGDVMFRLRDRQQRDMVLGPTHEEVITELASKEIRSYRQLPKTFYQIQTKFRDEIRPRFGLMRAKEFIMKDAYSFDAGWDEADASYEAMYHAYIRIFDRCGLRTKIVEADTGAMGGKWSHEFMVLADTGEDAIVECSDCSYAANVERAERTFPPAPVWPDSDKAPEPIDTPSVRTIDELSDFLKCEPQRFVKTLVYLVDGEATAILVPGDRDVNDSKLLRALGATQAVLADDATIERVTGAPVGFAGPVGLTVPVHADSSLKGIAGAVTGANRNDTHLANVNLERDADVTAYHDLCLVRDADGCPKCKAALAEKRGIEVGHVFKLGTKYSDSLHASYLDVGGHEKPLVMGCYGIGVTRTLQAVIEQSHDPKGIVWPTAIAPYAVTILVLDPKREPCVDVARMVADGLEERGIDVLLDDREERPGVKFNDADLLGLPIRVVVGERSLAKDSVEVKRRAEGSADLVPVAKAIDRLSEMVRGDLGETGQD